MSDYQVMPPLSADEYDKLRDEITEHGVLVPVVKDQHGNILDGHHRMRIADEIGVKYRVDVIKVDDDRHARSLARTYNLARRHLTREQKRQMIADEITDDPGRSDRAIARIIGVDHKTVGSVRRELRGEIPQSREIEQRIGFYRVHPFLATFPWVDEDAFASIVDSVQRFGLISPIVLTHDRKTLVDGRIRYRACEQAGVEPKFRALGEHYDERMILDYIWSVNVVRAHMTEGQQAFANMDTAESGGSIEFGSGWSR